MPDTSPLTTLTARALLAEIGAGNPTPGSGSASAFTGALSAALVRTVALITADRAGRSEAMQRKYGAFAPRAAAIAERAAVLGETLARATDEDCAQLAGMMALRRRRDLASDAERPALAEQARAALAGVAEVPLVVLRCGLELAELAAELERNGYQSAAPDARVGAHLALATIESAITVTESNIATLGPEVPWSRRAAAETAAARTRCAAMRTAS